MHARTRGRHGHTNARSDEYTRRLYTRTCSPVSSTVIDVVMDELAYAIDELCILPPAALSTIGTLRRVHHTLHAHGCAGISTEPTTDASAPTSSADIERLHEIFDACVTHGAPSVVAHYVDEVCRNESFVSDDGVEAYLRDGECVLAWATNALKSGEARLDGASGRPKDAQVLAIEDAMRTFDALRRVTETLGADVSGRTASDVAPQFKRLQSVRDEVVCRQLQAEALLWAANEGLSSGAVGARFGGPAAWAGAVQRRRALATESGGNSNVSTFLDDLLAGVGEHKPAYPFKTVSEAARYIFVDGSASPTALIAKRCLFLYFLLDSGLPHDEAPMRYATRARFNPRLFQETRAAVLLDDSANEASLNEACSLLPQIAHPLLPVKFIGHLAKCGRTAAALTVARARAPNAAHLGAQDIETISLDVSIRLACGLVAEGFLAVRDAFKALPDLYKSSSGKLLITLLVDHGVENLCLDAILSLPFYGDMENVLLNLLWERRDTIPVETGVYYLLHRGRALESAAFYKRAKDDGRLSGERANKLIEMLRKRIRDLPVSQKAVVLPSADAQFEPKKLAREVVVAKPSVSDLARTPYALLEDNILLFEAIIKGKNDAEDGALPFLKPPIELTQSLQTSTLAQATAALASASIISSSGRRLTWVRPYESKDAAENRSPMQSTAPIARIVEPQLFSPFGRKPTVSAHVPDNDTQSVSKSLLFGAQRPFKSGGSSSFPAFMTPKKNTPASQLPGSSKE